MKNKADNNLKSQESFSSKVYYVEEDTSQKTIYLLKNSMLRVDCKSSELKYTRSHQDSRSESTKLNASSEEFLKTSKKDFDLSNIVNCQNAYTPSANPASNLIEESQDSKKPSEIPKITFAGCSGGSVRIIPNHRVAKVSTLTISSLFQQIPNDVDNILNISSNGNQNHRNLQNILSDDEQKRMMSPKN